MCGRVIQSSGPLRYAIADGLKVRDSRVHNYPPRWNAAPSQELLVIRRNHKTGEVSLDPLRWGLIPYWCKDPAGGRKPINAKCETVSTLPTFRDAYRLRRCILPVDGFYEWKAIKGQRAKQPYAIAMKDGSPFGIAGLWENWKDPASGEWIRTFAVITTDANELVAEIHDRMPAILPPEGYTRCYARTMPAPLLQTPALIFSRRGHVGPCSTLDHRTHAAREVFSELASRRGAGLGRIVVIGARASLAGLPAGLLVISTLLNLKCLWDVKNHLPRPVVWRRAIAA
jgi:putative SOS response-associated peptidase YedK